MFVCSSIRQYRAVQQGWDGWNPGSLPRSLAKGLPSCASLIIHSQQLTANRPRKQRESPALAEDLAHRRDYSGPGSLSGFPMPQDEKLGSLARRVEKSEKMD